MGETAMTSSAHSPNSVLERYTISRQNSSIGFEIGNNVVLHMASHDEDESVRERDSSNVHTKIIMNHNCDVRQIAGRILTTHKKSHRFSVDF
ncbi:unnamed protein product [Caenorhabditis angaria]|uniref:Uncharacterized protein n=1 Tax=Caenorhabditis angaria TaxID=860376 RepID=A0A9P1I747_9PELO|nr:unnamed protein product [Caenorhabditis angaria]